MEGCLSSLNLNGKKKRFISSLNEDNFYEIDEVDYDEIEEVGMTDFERRQIKYAMRGSRCFFL